MAERRDYFAALNALLREVGSGVPRLVIDLDRLDHNIDWLRQLQIPERVRIVAKSLPSPRLLDYIFDRLGEQRLMVFHLPFLLQLIDAFPGADILLGKPVPMAAMRRFYTDRTVNAFDDFRQLQWLVDSNARLLQIIDLANELNLRISVSIELDIGMHRGGIASRRDLAVMLDTIRAHQDVLRLSGFMGYDAHVPKAPLPGSVHRAAARAQQRYGEFLEFALTEFADLEEREWCVNGAGSPTIAMHGDESPLNDYSIGSALVKPASFDLPTLAELEPAVWIASPVLKRSKGVHIPFAKRLPAPGRDTIFIYGGKWMAIPDFPPGMKQSKTYGVSSNQQMFTVPADSGIAVDDHVFLRPTQSEAVLLQFGDLMIVRGDRLLDNWPVLDNAGFPARTTAAT
jgi:D-serine deaminase-like pyridoxal phosphate-dependent protein